MGTTVISVLRYTGVDPLRDRTGDGERTEYNVDGESDKPNVIHLGYYVPERYFYSMTHEAYWLYTDHLTFSQRSLPITVSLDERAKDMIM